MQMAWNVFVSGKVLHQLTAKSPVRSCGFSLTDNILCFTTDKAMNQPCFIKFFDLRDKEQVCPIIYLYVKLNGTARDKYKRSAKKMSVKKESTLEFVHKISFDFSPIAVLCPSPIHTFPVKMYTYWINNQFDITWMILT